MRITSIGHRPARRRRRCAAPDDPWLSSQGAFQAAWYQYPANAHLDRQALLDCDFVTVSHEHLDHMDITVLTSLAPGTTVLIPKYPAPNFGPAPGGGRGQHHRGTVLAQVPAQRARGLADLHHRAVAMCHDAAVLVSVGGAALLHGNDARLTAGQARRAALECGRRLDVMAAQMASATWHPICYEYPAEQMAAIAAAKRTGKFRAVGRLLRLVKPQLVVPFAGPVLPRSRATAAQPVAAAAPACFPTSGRRQFPVRAAAWPGSGPVAAWRRIRTAVRTARQGHALARLRFR